MVGKQGSTAKFRRTETFGNERISRKGDGGEGPGTRLLLWVRRGSRLTGGLLS